MYCPQNETAVLKGLSKKRRSAVRTHARTTFDDICKHPPARAIFRQRAYTSSYVFFFLIYRFFLYTHLTRFECALVTRKLPRAAREFLPGSQLSTVNVFRGWCVGNALAMRSFFPPFSLLRLQ